MFRNLANTVAFCTLVDPIPIVTYCSAIHFRFASSEAQYLLELRKSIFDLLGDSIELIGLVGQLPQGNIDSKYILQFLIDALNFKGHLSNLHSAASHLPEHSWILNYAPDDARPIVHPLCPLPLGYKGIQSAVIYILRPFDQCNVLSGIVNKAVITLGPEISSNISMSVN